MDRLLRFAPVSWRSLCLCFVHDQLIYQGPEPKHRDTLAETGGLDLGRKVYGGMIALFYVPSSARENKKCCCLVAGGPSRQPSWQLEFSVVLLVTLAKMNPLQIQRMDGEEIALVDAKDVSGINSLQDLVNEVRYAQHEQAHTRETRLELTTW